MSRIVSTPHLRELVSQAGAPPFAHTKSEHLEKDLEPHIGRSGTWSAIWRSCSTTAKDLADGVGKVRSAHQPTRRRRAHGPRLERCSARSHCVV
ncbi:hypothetical protein ACFXKI_32565 [Streptomyces mirabilis]|uniref:hypothetical protein n=1 Tax=Streptomyces mirabilis TaxID=68239 RepID=UPI00367E68A2